MMVSSVSSVPEGISTTNDFFSLSLELDKIYGTNFADKSSQLPTSFNYTYSSLIQQDFITQPTVANPSPSLDSIFMELSNTSNPSLFDPPSIAYFNNHYDTNESSCMQTDSPQPIPLSPASSPFCTPSPCSSPSSPDYSSSSSFKRTRGKRPTDHTGTFQRAVQQVIKREGHIIAWRKFRAQRKGARTRTHAYTQEDCTAHVCTVRRAPCIKGYIAFCARMGDNYAGLLRDARYQNLGSRTECQCPNPFEKL